MRKTNESESWEHYNKRLRQHERTRLKAKKEWGLREWENLKIKAVKCGKPQCRCCPHGFYAYVRRKENNNQWIEIYLGKCFKNGLPRA